MNHLVTDHIHAGTHETVKTIPPPPLSHSKVISHIRRTRLLGVFGVGQWGLITVALSRWIHGHMASANHGILVETKGCSPDIYYVR